MKDNCILMLIVYNIGHCFPSASVHIHTIINITFTCRWWIKVSNLKRSSASGCQCHVSSPFTLFFFSSSPQDSDNPDLRDRGYIYWRLLSTDPVTAKEVVLSEKPLISEETDLIEPTLLDELICHIGSLASVYHKPPNAFVEGSYGIHRKHLPIQHGRY